MLDLVAVALMLMRPVPLVQEVYDSGKWFNGWACVALVEWESGFQPERVNRNDNGSVDYGLYQLNDGYHPQFRGDVVGHCRYGAAFLFKCLQKENGNLYWAFCRYNAWVPEYGETHGRNVSQIYWLITGDRIWLRR